VSLIRLLPIVAVAATVLGGCGGDAAESTTSASTPAATTATSPNTTPTTSTAPANDTPSAADVKKDRKVSAADVVLISRAVNRITAECVRRRNESGTVGALTAGFSDAVDVLVAEYADTPNRKFKRTGETTNTTMHATLQRIGTSLATPVPEGCGSTEKGATDPVAKKIRAALIARQAAKKERANDG
jgi:pyruvate/2-oxoglutarate dehydrogenase complex dihydrolipoamide acyltransferase (E2) component